MLVPFSGRLDATVLDAAIRIARAEEAVLVPAYLLIVPLRYAEDSPLRDEVEVAMPLLEAVEHAALRAGVPVDAPVDARIEKGRTLTHALRRLWEVERFDRIVAPAPTNGHGGFTEKELAWLLTHAPAGDARAEADARRGLDLVREFSDPIGRHLRSQVQQPPRLPGAPRQQSGRIGT